jgi:tRNA(fMet)-specific endonuclease VapC
MASAAAARSGDPAPGCRRAHRQRPVSDPEGLLDTSTLLLLPRIVDPSVHPGVPLISAITLAELSVGPLLTDDEAERARRLAHVQQAEADFDPIPFNAAGARAFGQVAASLHRSGRKRAARAFDALIAATATAMANGLPLYTCNPADFAGIDGLTVRPVAVPDVAPQPLEIQRSLGFVRTKPSRPDIRAGSLRRGRTAPKAEAAHGPATPGTGDASWPHCAPDPSVRPCAAPRTSEHRSCWDHWASRAPVGLRFVATPTRRCSGSSSRPWDRREGRQLEPSRDGPTDLSRRIETKLTGA